MNPRIILLSLIAVFTAFMPLTADAKKLFIADIEVDDEVEFEGTDSLFKVVDFFDNKSLKEFFPDYTPDSAVLARVDLRGVGSRSGVPSEFVGAYSQDTFQEF